VRVFEETEQGVRASSRRPRRDPRRRAWAQDTLEVARSIVVPGDELVLTGGARFDLVHHAIGDRGADPDRPRAGGGPTFSRTTPRFGINYNPTST